MTPGSLLNLVLKILGLFFARDILEALSQFVSVLVYFPLYDSKAEAWKYIVVSALSFTLLSVFSWLLVFRTDRLIRFLRLDSKLPQQITFNTIHRVDLLKIAIIFLGGWILVFQIPELARQMVYYVQEVKLYTRMAHPDLSYMIMAALKILFGFILVVWNRRIANIIEVKRRNRVAWYWPARIPFVSKRKKTG